jgi:hypothetical protein
MADLWTQAEGDRDRYLGLLRDHGWALQRRTLGQVLFDVLPIAAEKAGIPGFDDGTCDDLAAAMVPVLTDELGKDGYRIHDTARCVRPAPRPGDPPELGRPMTPEEEAALLPGSSPPAAGGPFEFTTPEGDLFLVPEGYTPGEKSSRCRSCDALILWCLTRNQKRAPMDPNGDSHFASCPDGPSWRKKAEA